MATDFLRLETACENFPERRQQQFSLFSSEDFRAHFQEIRQADPAKAIRACILYLSDKGADDLGTQMISSLAAGDDYLSAVLDPELLSLESAKRVCILFRRTDPYFFSHLSRLAFETQTPQPPAFTTRALAILDELSKDDPIVPWLRQLTTHPDERVRSKAVKVLCRLRPSKSTIDLHLQSADARVRANAIEALWHTPGSHAASIFHSVLNDPHHRVVANALVGLYYRKDRNALQMMIKLTEHSSAMFRVAMVWALGTVADRRAVPTLQKLLHDPSDSVKEKAQRILATFGPEPGGSAQQDPTVSQPSILNCCPEAPYQQVA
ncbi:MAG: HEAT repeat domain-containing protein [Bryobacteraceae bacterium]